MPYHDVQCLLVDDEPIARRILKNHLEKVNGFSVAGECCSALECFSALQQQQPDLLFLDIQMPQLNGLEFLRSLHHRPRVIMVSAHREYALEGFELDVVDYLLKPVSFERFLKALDKYRQLQPVSAPGPLNMEEAREHLFIRVDRKTVKLVLAEVLYMESMSDYLKIYTTGGMLLTKEKISVLEQKLPPEFMRIHRSYILNSRHLQAFTQEFVEVGDRQLPISRSFRQEVLEQLSR
ncbi:LytR/AlgR family response regulator transcription factor [Nafulsella turpanensis]|uniref:LytR/AlgR family response regulator transcription factor n=1 Tax=Nafulsella turpanensis TaxID=1265690 RepID=UPI0003450DD9|nr:response regulator transcription factor [Nafulsella turpanensis]